MNEKMMKPAEEKSLAECEKCADHWQPCQLLMKGSKLAVFCSTTNEIIPFDHFVCDVDAVKKLIL